ncbi:MAG TPA: hypothetical protein VGR57_06060 [Ktedonobacterales bacterium]|nr:hypothetical protein [Ktedonobacterales bacterium]
MAVNWAVLSAAFLASTVEFVEAFTIVLVIGVTINWRSSLVGAALAAGALAVIVAALGPALVIFVPIGALRLVVGVLLVLFGLKWLKKAILRYAGVKARHDEEAIYEEELAALRARGEHPHQGIDPFGVVTSFKSVLLEGLEVAFIVITFGSATATRTGGHGNSIGSATLGALAALALVAAAGAFIRGPLARVPENTLKFVVGIMLTSFGTFWGGEGLGIAWWHEDVFIILLIAMNLALAGGLILWLRPYGKGAVGRATASDQTTVPGVAQ